MRWRAIRMQTAKLTKRSEAMHCLWALQEAACRSCWDLVARVSTSAVDARALNKLNAAMGVPDAALRQRAAQDVARSEALHSSVEKRLRVHFRRSPFLSGAAVGQRVARCCCTRCTDLSLKTLLQPAF